MPGLPFHVQTLFNVIKVGPGRTTQFWLASFSDAALKVSLCRRASNCAAVYLKWNTSHRLPTFWKGFSICTAVKRWEKPVPIQSSQPARYTPRRELALPRTCVPLGQPSIPQVQTTEVPKSVPAYGKLRTGCNSPDKGPGLLLVLVILNFKVLSFATYQHNAVLAVFIMLYFFHFLWTQWHHNCDVRTARHLL